MSDDQPKRKPPGERPPVVVTYRTPSPPEPGPQGRGGHERGGPRGHGSHRDDSRRHGPQAGRGGEHAPRQGWDERPRDSGRPSWDDRGRDAAPGPRSRAAWDAPHQRSHADTPREDRGGWRPQEGRDARHGERHHERAFPQRRDQRDEQGRWDERASGGQDSRHDPRHDPRDAGPAHRVGAWAPREDWSQREERQPASRPSRPAQSARHEAWPEEDRRPSGGRPPARREFRDLGQAAIKPLNLADVTLSKSQGPWPVFLPCGQGIEELLLAEVQALMPEAHPRLDKGGVALTTDARGVMRLNLESRLATRVLLELAHAPYGNENDLYTLAKAVDWPAWISPLENFCINTSAHRSPVQSLNFATLRVKDGLCDRMREDTDDRPSVDTRFPHLQVALHMGPTQAHLYVDSSGESLFKRGWREDKGDAPLKETLAAAMLAAAGWKGTPEEGGALMDPCCGSGTIPIEAAQIACGIAPGLFRRFAFEMLPLFKRPEMRSLWALLKQEAKQRIHAPAVPIIASDVAFRMMDFAQRNAERAGVAHAIEFHGGDALQRPAPPLPEGISGTLMLNPPYGERIATRGTAAEDDFFPKLAAHWKRQYTGWSAWLLCPEMKLPGLMRLKESRRIPMWNGPIECRLFRFDLQAGSLRKDRQQDSEAADEAAT